MSNFTEGLDFYYNRDGLVVLTSTYHLKRGKCCGTGCVHCPYDYENVSEPKRKNLKNERPPVIFITKTERDKTEGSDES